MILDRDIVRAHARDRRVVLSDIASEIAAGHQGFASTAPLVVPSLASAFCPDVMGHFFRLVDAVREFHEYVSSPTAEAAILLSHGIAPTTDARSDYHGVLAERVDHLLDVLVGEGL